MDSIIDDAFCTADSSSKVTSFFAVCLAPFNVGPPDAEVASPFSVKKGRRRYYSTKDL